MVRQSNSPVALVTGAGRRLGRYIARELGRHGFTVVINYHNSRKGAEQLSRSLKSLGADSLVLPGDVSLRSEVHRIVKKTISAYGRIDLLVNSSAVFVDSPLLRTSEKVWDQTLNINLKGPFLCAQAVAPHMLRQKSGRIINIASLGGIQAWKEHIPYSVSKAGVIMLTRILAKSLAPHVYVNAIAPGTIIMEGEEDSSIRHLEKAKIPLAKYGRPSDITDLVLFLARARYITGQIFPVDGGRSIN